MFCQDTAAQNRFVYNNDGGILFSCFSFNIFVFGLLTHCRYATKLHSFYSDNIETFEASSESYKREAV